MLPEELFAIFPRRLRRKDPTARFAVLSAHLRRPGGEGWTRRSRVLDTPQRSPAAQLVISASRSIIPARIGPDDRADGHGEASTTAKQEDSRCPTRCGRSAIEAAGV